MPVRTYAAHDLGLTWVSDDFLQMTSHALAVDGRVWLIDPVDAGDALERATALGEPAGVLQLYVAHNRDNEAVAQRLGVPFHRIPATLPDAPFSIVPLSLGRVWKEVGLWHQASRTLVVGESVGTGRLFAIGDGPAGVHPLRRPFPPNQLRAFRPEHLLVGHGAPLHGEAATTGLHDALACSRRDIPRVLLSAPRMVRGALARR